MTERVELQLRRKYPGIGRRCDYENSRAAAISMMCRTCVGGSLAEVERCGVEVCPLWLYRPGKGKRVRATDSVPSLKWYLGRAAEARERSPGGFPWQR